MSETQECSVCGVKILAMLGGDRVLYSYGPPGTRKTLWKKICQHINNPECINQDGGK